MATPFLTPLLLVLLAALAPAAAQSPACSSNEGQQGRFPRWPVTYDMRSSTIIQPCNKSDFLDAELYSQFGVVSVDWSNAKQLWVQPPMACEELLVEQAARLKAARPGVRVMGYRNIVKALPWFSSVRARMDDAQHSAWFLPFDAHNKTPYHVPQCDNAYSPPKCTALYHDLEQVSVRAPREADCAAPQPLLTLLTTSPLLCPRCAAADPWLPPRRRRLPRALRLRRAPLRGVLVQLRQRLQQWPCRLDCGGLYTGSHWAGQ